ncbi:MAG: phospho-sugar mutase [bacterium]|nr:phospho-sugar mutase [bacterium]
MSAEIINKAKSWLSSSIDDDTRQTIEQMLNNNDDSELVECFYKDLEFGTGGLRGIMGVGSNRMNKYTVGMATQGLANYLIKAFPNQDIKVAIAHDSRNNSRFFAETTANVFSANGIKVFLFDELRPTPELSFAIRELACQSGVVLTASHNPKEYNGYKAYWNDGAQLVPPHDANVITEVQNIKGIDDINFAQNDSLIESIGEDIDKIYLDRILGITLAPEAVKNQKDLKIVFSSIHGTGITLVPKILEQMGFENVHVVEEQATPDGNFPTVVYPNPEESEALSIALRQAADIDADLVMATDPDSDRVGIAAKNDKGEFQLLNGNQTGSLLVYYLLTKWKENGKITGNQYVVKTIVTTELIKDIADSFEIKSYDTLTGFKYIAAVIKELEGKEEFIGGGEESYGYLISDFVRDKDAIASCAFIAEMTAYFKNQGKSLYEVLMEIYQQYGMYQEFLVSITKKGKTGAEEIQTMMANMRATPPTQLAGSAVESVIDYQSGSMKNMKSGSEETIDFPKSNVLQYLTEDGTKISARPSGTEPKIKFYFSVKTELNSASEYDNQLNTLKAKVDTIKKELNL